MARSIKQERRLLGADESTLVEKTHHPALGLLPDQDLAELRKFVRERRDRAQDIAARQRRELRGKAAPKGARATTDDSGTREKRDVLAAGASFIVRCRYDLRFMAGRNIRALRLRGNVFS